MVRWLFAGLLAVTVNRVAEKHFELLFSAGNSDTVHIRPSKIPYFGLIFLRRFMGAATEAYMWFLFGS